LTRNRGEAGRPLIIAPEPIGVRVRQLAEPFDSYDESLFAEHGGKFSGGELAVFIQDLQRRLQRGWEGSARVRLDVLIHLGLLA
jgi:hypothetical protein